MSTTRFYPYRTAPDSIKLAVEPEGSELLRGNDQSLLIYDADNTAVTLRVSVTVPREVLTRVIAPEEFDIPPVKTVLIYKSVNSRRRGAWQLNGKGEEFECSLNLERKDWAGSVTVQAVLTRSSANGDLPSEYGADLGSLLAWSEPLRFLFDEPVSPPGNTMEISWIDFGEVEWLEPGARQHLFALDTRGHAPQLLLNSAVTGLYSILNSRATHGHRARIRDATNYLITHQIWTSLISMSLRQLADTSELGEGTGPDLDDMGVEWQQHILLQWAQWIFPELDRDGSLGELISSSRTPTGFQNIMSRVPNAIQSRFQTRRGFDGLVLEIEQP